MDLAVRPTIGLQPFALEPLEPGEGNRLRLGQVAGAHHQEAAGDAVSRSVFRCQRWSPLDHRASRSQVSNRNIRLTSSLVGHPVQVLHQFRLSRVALLPLPSVVDISRANR